MSDKIEKLKKMTDSEIWKFLIEDARKDTKLYIMLDNDQTLVIERNDDANKDDDCMEIRENISNSYGVTILLNVLGIKNEHC